MRESSPRPRSSGGGERVRPRLIALLVAMVVVPTGHGHLARGSRRRRSRPSGASSGWRPSLAGRLADVERRVMAVLDERAAELARALDASTRPPGGPARMAVAGRRRWTRSS